MALLPSEMVSAGDGTTVSTQGLPGGEAAYIWKRGRNGPWRRHSSGPVWSHSSPPFHDQSTRLKLQLPRLNTGWFGNHVSVLTAGWRTHQVHPHSGITVCSTSSSKMHQACLWFCWLVDSQTFYIIKHHPFWHNSNVGCLCNKATVGFFLYTGTFCHSTLKTRTRTRTENIQKM